MSLKRSQLRGAATIASVALLLAACSVGSSVTSAPVISLSLTAAPTLAAPTLAAKPSASAALIPDGTYAGTPMDVAAVKALINGDTKLTTADKAYIIDNAFELDSHKTFMVTLEFHDGQYTEYQGFEGAKGDVGSRATFAFPDDHTLVIEETCCGISKFDVTLAQNGFSLKVRNGDLVSTEKDTIIGQILFESSPFTRVP